MKWMKMFFVSVVLVTFFGCSYTYEKLDGDHNFMEKRTLDTDILNSDGALGAVVDTYSKYIGIGCEDVEKKLEKCEVGKSDAEKRLQQCKDKPAPVDPGTTPDKPPVSGDLIMDHTNGLAWHGTGVALTQCLGDPVWTECEFEGTDMTVVKERDKGRHTWSVDNSSLHEGTIICKYGNKEGIWEVKKNIVPGKCYQSDR